MKLRWNVVLQTLAGGAQFLNVAAPFVPMKYQVSAAVVLAATQGVVAAIAHFSNPDGTAVALPYQPK